MKRAHIFMNFIGKKPDEVYQFFDHSGIRIYLDKADSSAETHNCVMSFCKQHNYNAKQAKALFYLRGHKKQVIHSRVLVGVLEIENLPAELYEIIHCLTFWNQEGADCYMMNAKKEECYSDFILNCIASDCKVFVEPRADRFITGKGGEHVWVSYKDSGERILFIHF